MDRRSFLQSSLYASLIYGAGSLPKLVNESQAAFAPLGNKRVLVNLMMNGAPDMRHIIVPAYSANANDFGYHYWRNRTRSHGIPNSPSQMQTYWNNNFDHYQHPSNGTTFGIAKSCAWLSEMWTQGNLAILCNVYGGDTRAHDYAVQIMNQGNRLSSPGQLDRSGWGGRLSAAANENTISLTNVPSRFCFGPNGTDINKVNNANLVSVANSREIGLYEFDRSNNARSAQRSDQIARSAKSYYKSLQTQLDQNSIYQRFLEHESKLRQFGGLVRERLSTVPLPQGILDLYNQDNGNTPLLDDIHLGYQIRNTFDSLACHDILSAKVLSMEVDGWDSHADQTEMNRKFSDLYGDNRALSALWKALDNDVNANRENIVFITAGEFGRQLRDNGGNGTDHGEGNMSFVFGEQVNGGIYGDLFPNSEIELITNSQLSTPDTKGLTQWDHPFSEISNWVQPNSSSFVFPDQASADIEQVGMFNSLFT